MKIKRKKHVKKVLSFYKINHDLRPPYNILVDGTFCKAALKFKINIAEQLPKYLDAQVSLKTTRCVKKECSDLVPLLYGPLKVLEQYEEYECHHYKGTPASKCINRVIKHDNKLIIATQDAGVWENVQSLTGVPLLHISHSAITLDDPSPASTAAASESARSVMSVSTTEHDKLKALKKEALGVKVFVKRKKKKGPKGPNPLSCKRKKTKPSAPVDKDKKKCRKRRKKT